MEGAAKKTVGDRFREWVQFTLLLFASAWGAYTFVYKEIYIPAQRPAVLTISGSLDEMGCTGNLALVRARIHAINKKDVRIYAPALWFTVKGHKIIAKQEMDQSSTFLAKNTPISHYPFTAKYSYEYVDVIAVWMLPDETIWYDPGDETTNEESFYVPLGQYQVLRLELNVIVAKNRDRIASVKWDVEDDGSFKPVVMMKKHGYEKNLELKEPYDSTNNPEHRDWEAKYGIGENWSVTTISLLRSASKGNGTMDCMSEKPN